MKKTALIFGDCLALALVTVIGFASHGETGLSYAPRMLTTFIPLLLGWFLVAPWLGLFDMRIASDPKNLWRPPLAMSLAAPMTAILRAAMLRGFALPLFTLILGGSAALGMLVWRWIWMFASRRVGSRG